MSSVKLKHASGGAVSITAPESNPASDRTLYVPSNADGTLLTTSYGPAFFARNDNTQSISNGSATKVQFDTQIVDTDNCYDHSTNYRFTPNIAGYYLIVGNVHVNSTSGTLEVNIYKNGSRFSNLAKNSSGSGGQSLCLTSLVSFNGSSDYVEIYVYQVSGSSKSLANGTTHTLNEFSGSFVRGL